jgi:hypothetical protein
MKQITAKIKVNGGRLLSAANAPRIIARDTRPTDKMGNSLPSPIFRFKNDPPYFQKWVIKKEPKGYIFREVTHGGGICGCHPTVRDLVISTLFSNHIVVEVAP